MTPVAVSVTDRGTVSAGRRRAEKVKAQSRPSRLPHLALLVVGVLASGAAWVFLVRAAIDFGEAARDGRSVAWAICAAATLGAAVCLMLVFALLARIPKASGLLSEYTPRRSSGGRRSR